MKITPTIVAYKSDKDLFELKEWFYNFNSKNDYRQRAINKVEAMLTRGRLPHGIEATSLLSSVILTDLKNPNMESNVLQLSYTMAIIRFVNGLIDPFQKSNYVVPMQLLAKQLNLPTSFVELRHMGTHENLPSLEMLRIACENALNWLFDHYWCHVNEDIVEELQNENDIYFEVVDFRTKEFERKIDNYSVYDNLKLFKKERKDNLDEPLDKYNDIKFKKCIKELIEFGNSDPSLLIDILIRKYYIIYPNTKLKAKKIKYNPLFEKLYKPLFDELNVEFHLRMLYQISNLVEYNDISEVSQKLYKKLGFSTILSHEEAEQLIEWTPYLIKFIFSVPFSQVPSTLCCTPTELLTSVFDKLKTIYKSDQTLNKLLNIISVQANEKNYDKEMIEKLNTLTKKNQATKDKPVFELPPSIDDLLAEDTSSKRSANDDISSNDDNTNKKRKKNSNEKKVYLLEEQEDWRPTPFGMCI
ncbi:LAS1 [Candida jiufengensis]|uniref:LAS1 n=1 Tax=Candida jiufengensis TaxID=497108 RepID=UPI002224B208|nr:LAS1 [Candida jiufengensis]KAI5951867.1 LAS1 [Candida jiufengensis]